MIERELRLMTSLLSVSNCKDF